MTALTLNASRKTKKTAIGEIPVDWEFRRLEELVQLNPRREKQLSDNKVVSFVPMASVTEDGKLVDVHSVPFKKVANGFTYFQNGDVLVAKITPCFENGKGTLVQGMIGGIGFGSTEFHVIRPSSKIHTQFLFYHTVSHRFRARGVSSMTGSAGQKRLPAEYISAYHIALPPLPEQRGIVDVLEAWDRAIERGEKLLAAKQQLKQGLMQGLLTGKTRFKQFRTEKWKVYRLSDLLERVFRPVTLSNETPLDLISIRRRAGGLFFRGSVTAREFMTVDLNRIEAGDFLVSKRQVTHGALAMVRKDFEGMHVSNEYVIFRCRASDKLHLPFFDWLSRSPRMWHMAYLASNGVHIEKLIFDADDFLKEKISLPPSLVEQQKIVEVLEASDAEIRLLERELAVLHDQKRGLMQKLLTGKVRVRG